MDMVFTEKELAYLRAQRLGRLATVTPANQAHVVPTAFRVSDDATAIEIGGHTLSTRRPLYLRNIETNPWVAYVVDDVASINPWAPRGVSIRGRAEIHPDGGERLGPGFDATVIVIVAARVTSWGIEGPAYGPPSSRKIR
jgi:pyridoxamine 5'-phosphate oxidase family protein